MSTMSDAEGAKFGMNARGRLGVVNFGAFLISLIFKFCPPAQLWRLDRGGPEPFLGVGKYGSLAAPQLS